MKPRESRAQNRGKAKDCSPLKWDKYFDRYEDVTIHSDSFRYYTRGTEGPVLVLLHGGGYSALTWALFTKEITNRINCQVLALDIRGHGDTHTKHDENLSIDRITCDVVSVIEKSCGRNPIVLIGHSMGGAVAVHCAHQVPNAIALCVIDVVEGSAIESLPDMNIVLRNRPANFKSLEDAIKWCYSSGHTHNLESARVSMPGQIKNCTTGQLAASEVTEDKEQNEPTSTIKSKEEATAMKSSSYVWRIDLRKTEHYWRGWFQGLSEHFLNTPVPKLLLLNNIHRLDTTLTVGQMQGKFQMQVLSRCAHAIHEDLPQKVADTIASFLIRHGLTMAVGEFSPLFSAW